MLFVLGLLSVGCTAPADPPSLDAAAPSSDAGAGAPDLGADAGTSDADAGAPDLGADAGTSDADAGAPDLGADAGTSDGDAGAPDLGADAGTSDRDAGAPDLGGPPPPVVVAMDDSAMFSEEGAGGVIDVLGNDTSTAGPLQVGVGTDTTSDLGGTVRIGSGNQSVVYTPPPATCSAAQDRFQYVATAGALSDSAVVTVDLRDTVAPGAITDLRLGPAGRDRVELSFTAPSENGTSGQCSPVRYELRSATSTTALSLSSPLSVGATETRRVTLAWGQLHAVELMAVDEAGQRGPVQSPPVEVDLRPSGSVSPSGPLELGWVNQTEVSRRDVRVANTSPLVSLDLSTATVAGSNAFAVTNGGPRSLTVGASSTVTVSYQWSGASLDTGTLTLPFDGPGSPLRVSLQGRPDPCQQALGISCSTFEEAYVKASNAEAYEFFGWSVALSGDGSTLAVGAYWEDSSATGVGGNQADNSATNSGAVYVFRRVGSTWSQEAYIKASNTDRVDYFGWSVALSGDGSTLAVGAYWEASSATGVGGNQANNFLSMAGAVYAFRRVGSTWSQEAYIKASNTNAGDRFGASVALSGDGTTLAVGASEEGSDATGVGGNQANNLAPGSGAVYVFRRVASTWSQEAYIKASNTSRNDAFGASAALSGDGSILAVGAVGEDSSATGVGGNQFDNSARESGAVYVFRRVGSTWSQDAYIKASNTNANDAFGESVALSGDGSTLAVGAYWEDSSATGVGGNQADDSVLESGAVYVFRRVGSTWSQDAYIKASNTDSADVFGGSVALSGDGSILAVGAVAEDSTATGVGGNQANNSAIASGAVYVFRRVGSTWSQYAYIKASNTDREDEFGSSVALSGDGSTLAVGAHHEWSSATGVGGNQADNSARHSGAVYVRRIAP